MLKDLKSIKVLPIIAFFITSKRMSLLTTENLNLEKACLVNLGLDESICQSMAIRNKSGYAEYEEIEVHKLVASMVGYKQAILGIFPFFIMIFLVSWSDLHRIRKPFILIPIYGHIIMNFGCFVCSFFLRELPLEVAIFFESVPVAITGSFPCFFVGIHSYVSENSSLEKRTYLIGITVMFTWMFKFVGIALSGVLHKLLGFYGVYCLCVIFDAVAIIYGSFVVKEVKSNESKRIDIHSLRDIFDYRRMFNSVRELFQNKNSKINLSIIMLLLIASLRYGTNKGQDVVTYMFTRRKFTWDEVDYSGYIGYHSIMNSLGSLLSISIFVRWMKLDDAIIGMMAMISGICGCITNSIATNSVYFYLAAIPEIFALSDQMVTKSIISKLVPADKLGKAFSISAVFEAPTPLIFGPLYSFVYYKSVHFLPGAFFILIAITQASIFFMFLCLYLMKATDLVELDRKNQENINSKSSTEELERGEPHDKFQNIEMNVLSTKEPLLQCDLNKDCEKYLGYDFQWQCFATNWSPKCTS